METTCPLHTSPDLDCWICCPHDIDCKCSDCRAAEEAYWEYESQRCECEIDWNCGCGRNGGLTWIEVRYQGMDPEEDARERWLESLHPEPF